MQIAREPRSFELFFTRRQSAVRFKDKSQRISIKERLKRRQAEDDPNNI